MLLGNASSYYLVVRRVFLDDLIGSAGDGQRPAAFTSDSPVLLLAVMLFFFLSSHHARQMALFVSVVFFLLHDVQHRRFLHYVMPSSWRHGLRLGMLLLLTVGVVLFEVLRIVLGRGPGRLSPLMDAGRLLLLDDTSLLSHLSLADHLLLAFVLLHCNATLIFLLLTLLLHSLFFQSLLFQTLLFQSLLFQSLLFQALLFQALLLQALLFQSLLLQALLFQSLLFQALLLETLLFPLAFQLLLTFLFFQSGPSLLLFLLLPLLFEALEMQQLLSFVLLEPLLFFLSLSLLLRLRNALHRFRRGKLLLVLLLHLNLLLLLLTFNLADHMVHFLRWLLLGHLWWPILGLLLAFGTLLLLDERLLDRPGFGHTALSGQMRRRSVALIHERVDGQIQPGRGSVRAQWARVPMRRRVSTGVRHLPRVRLVRRAGRLSDGGITRDRPSPRRYRPSSQRASGRQIEFLGDLNSGWNSVRS